MPSTYSNLKIQLMATGENNTTWGDVTNTNLGVAIEEAIVGSADVTFASNNVTLTLTNANTTQTARNLRLNLIGTTGGSPRNLVVPAIEKPYIVNNTCGDTVTVKTAAGTGIAVPAGSTTWVYCDATNVVDVVTKLTDLTVTGTLNATVSGSGANLTNLNASNVTSGVLTVANGGTGTNTLTGLIKGSGTSAFSAATAGTDYVAPGTATNFTATQTFSGSTSAAAAKLINATEKVTISGSGAASTITMYPSTQSVLYYTGNASGNWTVNFAWSAGTSMNTALAVGDAITVVVMATQGSPAYYNNVVQVDGTASGVTTKWQTVAPSAGYSNSINVYSYTITKTGSGTFTVLATLAQFV